MLMKYNGIYDDPRIFFEKLHNLLRFCVHLAKKFAKHVHALSEMILLRGELGRITFDVDIVECRSIYAHVSPSS